MRLFSPLQGAICSYIVVSFRSGLQGCEAMRGRGMNLGTQVSGERRKIRRPPSGWKRSRSDKQYQCPLWANFPRDWPGQLSSPHAVGIFSWLSRLDPQRTSRASFSLKRDQASGCGGGRGKGREEREKESQTGSTPSKKPIVGLDLTALRS